MSILKVLGVITIIIVVILVIFSLILANLLKISGLNEIFRAFSRMNSFGRTSVFDAMEAARELEKDTPASIAAMTSIYLPKIMKDFPELNYEEMKNTSETILKSFFQCINKGELDKGKISGENLREIVRQRIDSNKALGKKEVFREIKIHRTEIRDYVSKGSFCRITLQSAVEYKYSENEIVSPTEKCQTKWNQEWLYIQDPDKLPNSIKASDGFGLVCPNCGGPVKSIGQRACEYCGSAIVPINMKVWELHEIKKA